MFLFPLSSLPRGQVFCVSLTPHSVCSHVGSQAFQGMREILWNSEAKLPLSSREKIECCWLVKILTGMKSLIV